MSEDNLQRAIGRLEGEMIAMRDNVANVDKKLDRVLEQTTTLRIERARDRKKHTSVVAIVTTVGTFVGAVLAKLSGHI